MVSYDNKALLRLLLSGSCYDMREWFYVGSSFGFGSMSVFGVTRNIEVHVF